MRKFLFPIASLYQLITFLRNKFYDKNIFKSYEVEIPVISIGNITVGGTGKTPFTISLAKILLEKGFRPAIITRGYKRKTKDQIIVSEGNGPQVSALKSGDEPFLMAEKTKNIVIIADRNRYEAAKTAHEEYNCDIILADDAFQHRKLKRDIDIVLWDASASPQKERILPVGRLRESLVGLKRADMIVFTRTNNAKKKDVVFFENNGLDTFVSPTIIENIHRKGNLVDISVAKGKNLAAFCGLGNHEQFFDTVKKLEPAKLITAEFPDHHKYSEVEIEKLLSKTKEYDYLITTEKDLTNIPEKHQSLENLLVLSISLKISYNLIEEIMKSL